MRSLSPLEWRLLLLGFSLLGACFCYLLGHKIGRERAEDKCVMLMALWAPQALDEHAASLGVKKTEISKGLYLYQLPDDFQLFAALDWAHDDQGIMTLDEKKPQRPPNQRA